MELFDQTTSETKAMMNYYQLIRVEKDASPKQIRAALRVEERRWRVQRNAPDPERRQEAERMLREIAEAAAVLLDPARRQEYDAGLCPQASSRAPEDSGPRAGDPQGPLQELNNREECLAGTEPDGRQVWTDQVSARRTAGLLIERLKLVREGPEGDTVRRDLESRLAEAELGAIRGGQPARWMLAQSYLEKCLSRMDLLPDGRLVWTDEVGARAATDLLTRALQWIQEDPEWKGLGREFKRRLAEAEEGRIRGGKVKGGLLATGYLAKCLSLMEPTPDGDLVWADGASARAATEFLTLALQLIQEDPGEDRLRQALETRLAEAEYALKYVWRSWYWIPVFTGIAVLGSAGRLISRGDIGEGLLWLAGFVGMGFVLAGSIRWLPVWKLNRLNLSNRASLRPLRSVGLSSPWRRWPWVLAGAVVLLAVAGMVAWRNLPPGPYQPGWRNPADTPPARVRQEIAGIGAGVWHPPSNGSVETYLSRPYTPTAVVQALYARYGPATPGGTPRNPNFPRWIARLRLTSTAAQWLANQNLNPTLTAQILGLALDQGDFGNLAQALSTAKMWQDIRVDHAAETPEMVRNMDRYQWKHLSWDPFGGSGVAAGGSNRTMVSLHVVLQGMRPKQISGILWADDIQMFERKVHNQWRAWQMYRRKFPIAPRGGK